MASTLYLFIAILCITVSTSFTDPIQCFECTGTDCYIINGKTLPNITCSNTDPFDLFDKILAAFGFTPAALKFVQNLQKTSVSLNEWSCINFAFEHDHFDGTEYAIRTCVSKELFEGDICDSLDDIMISLGGTMDYCATCEESNCNSAITLQRNPIFLSNIIAIELLLLIVKVLK